MNGCLSRCSAAKVSNRIRCRNSLAFLDEEAAATGIPLSLTARMSRNASGNAVKRFCAINARTCSCLAAAYRSTRPSTSSTPKNANAARAPASRGMPRHDLLVHRGGETLRSPAGLIADVAPLPLHQVLQRFAPGQVVRRVDQNAIHIEDRTSVRHPPHRSFGSPVGRSTAPPARVAILEPSHRKAQVPGQLRLAHPGVGARRVQPPRVVSG